MLKPHGLFLFGYSPKKEAKKAAATSNFLKTQINCLKSEKLASLKQLGFFNDNQFDFLNENSLRRKLAPTGINS